EDIIPEWRANSVARVVVIVMMSHVIFLQKKPDPAFHRKMVRRVVHHIVEKITDEKTAESHWRKSDKAEQEQTVKKEGERNAHDGRHNEPAGIFRIIVVNPMKEKMKLLP